MASPRRRPPCPEAPFLRGARREKGPTGNARLVLPPPFVFPARKRAFRATSEGKTPASSSRRGLRSRRLVAAPWLPTPLPSRCRSLHRAAAFAPPVAPCAPLRRPEQPPPPVPPHPCAFPDLCLPRPVPSPAASPFAAPFPGGPFFRRRATFRATSPFFHAESPPCLPRFGRRLRQRLRAFQKRAFHARSDKNRLYRFSLRTGKRETFSLISSVQEKNHIHNNTIRHRFFFFKKSFSHNDIPLFFIFLYFHVHLSFQDIHYFHKIAFIMTKYA